VSTAGAYHLPPGVGDVADDEDFETSPSRDCTQPERLDVGPVRVTAQAKDSSEKSPSAR
jgi:hypothetical protein